MDHDPGAGFGERLRDGLAGTGFYTGQQHDLLLQS